MPRKDYEEIKRKFAEYVKTWKSADASKLSELAQENVEFICSGAKNANDEWNSFKGLEAFTQTYPRTDVIQLAIYNYACNLALDGVNAQQSAIVCIESLNYVDGKEEMQGFSYSITCAVHWIKKENSWKMDQVHMDIYDFYWTDDKIHDYFRQTWYFGSKLVADGNDGRLPAIEGEFDLPWEKYPECEDVLTEEEKILYSAARMFTSADYSININRCITRSDYIQTNSDRYGYMEGIRSIVNNKRYKRLKDRYWCHPWRFDEIEFSEDRKHARCVTYRPFGWKQRNHEFVWTRSNVGIEHACVGGAQPMEYVLEDGQWKWACDGGLTLLIGGLAPFPESLYGDRVLEK